MIRSAEISGCGRYRYALRRAWDSPPWRGGHEKVCWIMLNPSTANAEVDDPTIRRCIGFSRARGYGSLVVVNLFAYRTPYPKALKDAGWAVGDENDEAIIAAARESALVVAAWGAQGHPVVRARARRVFDLLSCPPHELVLECVGVSSEGDPRHPLMVRADAPLVRLERLP